MNVVILVPRREGFPDRDELWAWTKDWWSNELPEFPIIEGHHNEGLFNRSAALNRASRIAGDWDIALIIDADVICDPEHVREAVRQAAATGRVVVPFLVRHNMSRFASRKIMGGYKGPWTAPGWIAQNFMDQHSSVIAVPRNAWETAGGFDETFAGWGMEDTAFALTIETLVGPLIHMEGEVWHLWHATAPEGHRGTPSAIANRARGARYQAAKGDPDAIRALLAEQFPATTVSPAASIPRILHRVVPEALNETAERWWAEFEAMHPDWQLMTHRDPLDPDEWPLTSEHWDRCGTGAQLAGLIRLEALIKWGGIYVDQDVQPFRPLDPLLPLSAFAAWEDQKVVPDAVLGATAGHPAMKLCLEDAIEHLDAGAWESGPGATTRNLPGRNDVLLLPPGSLYAVHYRDPKRDQLMTDPRTRERNPWAFVLHHYWGSWLPEARRRVPA